MSDAENQISQFDFSSQQKNSRGGVRPGSGRPKGKKDTKPRKTKTDSPKNRQAAQRWTAEEWEAIEKAAATEGITPSEYIRRRILEGLK